MAASASVYPPYHRHRYDTRPWQDGTVLDFRNSGVEARTLVVYLEHQVIQADR